MGAEPAGAALLEAALDAIPFGFCIFDPDFKLLAWNRKYGDLHAPGGDLCAGMSLVSIVRTAAGHGRFPGRSPELVARDLVERLTSGASASLVEELEKGRFVDIEAQRIEGLGWALACRERTFPAAREAFDPDLTDAARARRRRIEAGLERALARGELELVFQPLVSLEKNRISCFETLLRWTHPEDGPIPPGEFIAVAEETGLIVRIGAWTLAEACRRAAAWPSDVRVAVNLSPVQFRQQGLTEMVATALADSRLGPDRLELEITESLLLENSDTVLATLHRLRASGIRIAMDDFGIGYSSLSYLRSFPFDKIKIDRSFMADIETRPDSRAIIKAMVGLGRSLGISIAAEGIESEGQLRAVLAHGCDEAQGYLFSPPLTAQAAKTLLATARRGFPRLDKAVATRRRAATHGSGSSRFMNSAKASR